MSDCPYDRLKSLGLELPEVAGAAANYVPFVVTGNTVYVSGQIPFINGDKGFIGTVGDDMTLETGQEAARICALNIIAQVQAACGGDLKKVKRCIKLMGFVNSTPDFTKQSLVINGASDLMVEIFGDKGRHARVAVSAPSLPFGVGVEIDALFEIEG